MINPFKSSKFKRNKEKFLAIFGAVILITFWLAGYLAQFSMDAFLSDEAHQTWNPFVCIPAAIANPQVLGVFDFGHISNIETPIELIQKQMNAASIWKRVVFTEHRL